MKKVIFDCIGNSVLFILAGLMLIRPFSDYRHTQDELFVVVGIMPFIFVAYLAAFIVIRFLIFKNEKRPENSALGSELAYADEREKIIAAESAKTAYQALVFGLIVSLAVLAGTRAFSFMFEASVAINIYFVGIMLVTLNLVAAMVSYCLKWCVEYWK